MKGQKGESGVCEPCLNSRLFLRALQQLRMGQSGCPRAIFCPTQERKLEEILSAEAFGIIYFTK